jgi:hypothetical protein
MNEQEAQQAQAIKRIGEMLNTPWGHDVGVWVANCEDLREIVDSQAQKIQDLQNGKTIGSLHHQIATLEVKVAEARKLAEKMRDASERPGGGHTFLPWERKP